MSDQNFNIDEDALDIMLKDASLHDLDSSFINRQEIRKILQDNIIYNMESADILTNIPTDPSRPPISIETDPDGMLAFICLNPPQEEDPPITEELLRKELLNKHIYMGVNTTVISRLARTPIYHKPFVIAKGKAPKFGTPARVEYYFDTDYHAKPLNEKNGRLNFSMIDFAQNVKTGDLLCEIIPSENGKDGFTVFGDILSANSDENAQIHAGRNTQFSKDQLKLYATCDGEVTMTNGIVSVEKILRLKNVNATTGNILFVGTVYVEGKIQEGFTVKATNHIIVGDVIEEATIITEGDLIVRRGIKGGVNGSITVSGMIQSYYIENAIIKAGKDIFADVILRSDITCEGSVSLRTQKGFLIGGICRARELHVSKLGNQANILTQVEILNNHELENDLQKSKENLGSLEELLKRFQNALSYKQENSVDIQKAYIQCLYQKNEAINKVKTLTKKLERINNTYHYDIKISNRIHSNVSIRIHGLTYLNSEARAACTIFYSDYDIQFRPYCHS